MEKGKTACQQACVNWVDKKTAFLKKELKIQQEKGEGEVGYYTKNRIICHHKT